MALHLNVQPQIRPKIRPKIRQVCHFCNCDCPDWQASMCENFPHVVPIQCWNSPPQKQVGNAKNCEDTFEQDKRQKSAISGPVLQLRNRYIRRTAANPVHSRLVCRCWLSPLALHGYPRITAKDIPNQSNHATSLRPRSRHLKMGGGGGGSSRQGICVSESKRKP